MYPTYLSAQSYRIDSPLSQRALAVRVVYNVVSTRVAGTDHREAMSLSEAIVDESSTFGFDPLFILAVIEAESEYNVEAVSKTGARGLMQVLPSTFRAFSSAPRMMDPVENVRVGIRFLGSLSRSFKRPDSLLLAYNAGPGGAHDILHGEREHSEESRNYAPKVMKKYSRLLKESGKDPNLAKKTYIRSAKVVR